jgi:allantoicase
LTDGLDRLNALSAQEAEANLRKCCGSANWARRMTQLRPFPSPEKLAEAADRVWRELQPEDWLEAFRSHPRIGEKASASDSAQARRWAGKEQSGASAARPEILEALARANREYESRFGFIFIVCATGKSADEMLALLEHRLQNDPGAEIRVAAEEQRKITRLRLEKLLRGE